jgi:hypothetical protein
MCSMYLLDVMRYERDKEIRILQNSRAAVRTREDGAGSILFLATDAGSVAYNTLTLSCTPVGDAVTVADRSNHT